MSDFKPGDEVVCVDAKPDRLDPLAGLLAEGTIYVVANCGPRSNDGEMAVAFQCLPSGPGQGYGFCVRRFRKVQRRDLTAWLATATKFEEPKRAPVLQPGALHAAAEARSGALPHLSRPGHPFAGASHE